MANGGISTKLRSVFKKLNSFSRRSSSSISSRSSISPAGAISDDDSSTTFTHPVYVGKSRRLYHVGTDVIHHPLFRELVERSCGDDPDTTTVSCEVVLFEHLLWMLENTDDSVDGQLADFYACW